MNAPLQRIVAVCHTCNLKHLCSPLSEEASEFYARHRGHALDALVHVDPRLAKLAKVTGADTFEEVAPGRFRVERMGVAGYAENANVKQAFGAKTAFTKTNANLASSVTAGWKSNAIDNSANLYDDALVHTVLAAVNTAPSSQQAIFLFAFGLIDSSGTAYTSTGDGTADGSEGTLTYPDVSAKAIVAPLLGVVPYPAQNKAINGGPFSVARCFGGILSPKWCIGMVNASGMTLSVTDIGYIEVYYTVA